MRGALLLLALLAALPAGASAAPSRGHACGSFVSKNQRLYVYVTRGRTHCAEARRVLHDWFVDAGGTQKYGRWTCFDSTGSALDRGQIQHCSSRRREQIADYDGR